MVRGATEAHSFLETAVEHTIPIGRPEGDERVQLFSLQVGTTAAHYLGAHGSE